MGKKKIKSRDTKRQQFIEAGVKSNRKMTKPIFITVIIATVLLISGLYFTSMQSSQKSAAKRAKSIAMTEVTAKVANDKITVSESAIKNNDFIRFEYQGVSTVPLLAYTGPSGKIITAVSVCEPCESTHFHIKNNTLVCDACGTVWELETHKGVSGGCMDYPPAILNNTINGGQVEISEILVSSWKPRPL